MVKAIETMKKAQLQNLGGTIRTSSAEDTLTYLSTKLKTLGITRVARITGLDNLGIPVSISIRPMSKHLTTAQGKGTTQVLADISAIMESVESFHLENPPDPIIFGSFNELVQQKKLAIDPLLFKGNFFKHNQLRNLSMSWVEARNLFSHKKIYLPHPLVSLDSTKAYYQQSFFKVSTNGLAAGNTLDEAMCHSLFELIERDAYARWCKLDADSKKARELLQESISSQIIQKLLMNIQEANVECKIWDITSPIKLPSFFCTISSHSISGVRGSFAGMGTHISREVALSRAITEAAQSRLTFINGTRDDVFPAYYKNRFNHNNNSVVAEPQKTFKRYDTCVDYQGLNSFKDYISKIISLIKDQDIRNVFVVNHTKSSINIPVVQCFAPELEYDAN